MKQELSLLTGVRFLAAFYVFVFHIHIHTQLTFLPQPIQFIISQGALGVNFFFVLSGFLLGYSHLKDFPTGQFRDWAYYRWFMFKRFSRIYPVYFVGLLLSLIVSIIFTNRSPVNIILLDAFLLESYTWPNALWGYGTMAWSVSTEVFFYLLLPLLLPLLLRVHKQSTLWILLVTCCIVGAVPGLLHNLFPTQVPISLTYVFPPLRLAEFVAGIITALLVFRHKLITPAWLAGSALLVLVGWLLVVGPHYTGFVVHNIVVIPVLSIVLAALAQPDSSASLNWLGNSIMVYLGRISYSFYIAQQALRALLEVYLKQDKTAHSSSVILLVMLIANLFVAVLLYEIIEKKSHKWLLTFGNRHLRATLRMAA
jgi:peptidoglycan/LPS O-acetylase OafA/YrhL